MSRPSLSVIIPTYNGARFVGEAIESVFGQTRLPDELVVVDDASSDETVAVVERLAGRAPLPLRTIRLAKNSGGPARPTNVGIQAAAGELIAVLDQDDLYETEILALAGSALDQSPQASLAFWWAAGHDQPHAVPLAAQAPRRAVAAAGRACLLGFEIPGPHLVDCLLRYGTFIHGFPGFVFRRSGWQAKGGIDESFRISGDMNLLGWLFAHGDGVLIPRVGYRRREHAANATSNSTLMYAEIARVTAELLAANPNADAEAAAAAKARLEMIAYWFREGQCYAESAQLYRLLGRLGEPRLKTSLALAKLNCHRVLSSVLGREPVYTPITRPRMVSVT